MPLYTWTDRKSGTTIDVLRSFNDYEQPPTKEEAPDLEDPEWERNIGDKIAVIRPYGWKKGEW